MKTAFQRQLLQVLAGVAVSTLLMSCGGGGSSSAQGQSGGVDVRVLPENGTFYAGVPNQLQVIGGRPPYTMSSSEPQVMPVPQRLDGHNLDVVPNNPGVIDANLKPEELPVRSVTITAADSNGLIGRSVIKVAQNFLTGYGVALTPTTCPSSQGQAAATACAGGETAIQLNATTNGSLHGNEQFRLQVLRGNYALRNPVTGQSSETVLTTSDHTGSVLGIIQVPAGALTQIAVLRVTHVATGVYADHAFVISGTGLAGTLTAIPTAITFKGALANQCGTGQSDVLVFDGVPPYTATSTSPNVVVTPSTSNSNPARFTVTVTNQTVCVDATVVITDSLNKRVTVTVKTEAGTGTLPALAVAPTAITLACGTSGSASVVGGSGAYSVTSSHPRVSAVVSGNIITVTRVSGDGAGTFPTTGSVTVSDGSALTGITVTVPANCP